MGDAVIGSLAALGSILFFGSYVFIAYIWGGYVFKEPLKDHSLSLLALVVMTVGMIGVGAAVSGKKGFQSLLNITLKLKENSHKMEDCSQYSCVGVSDSSKPLIMSDIAENSRDEEECGHHKNERSNDFIKGVTCAILVGTLNGSFMIPLKYANKDVVGIEYLLSFGIGAMSMTVVLLAIYMTVLSFCRRPLPALYVPGAARTALLAGILWSLGNFFSIYATLYLGVAIGWPLVQCQLLVSAMWAVFYYKEVGSVAAASLLFGSSVCVVSGAIMLSQYGSVG